MKFSIFAATCFVLLSVPASAQISFGDVLAGAMREGFEAAIETDLPVSTLPAGTPRVSIYDAMPDSELRRLQRALAELGYYQGPIDGQFGRGSRTAAAAFQHSINAPADGYLTVQQVSDLLSGRPSVGETAPNVYLTMSKEELMRLQSALAALGHYDGRIDGQFGEGSRAAAAAYQSDSGKDPSGYLSVEEIGHLLSQPDAAGVTSKADGTIQIAATDAPPVGGMPDPVLCAVFLKPETKDSCLAGTLPWQKNPTPTDAPTVAGTPAPPVVEKPDPALCAVFLKPETKASCLAGTLPWQTSPTPADATIVADATTPLQTNADTAASSASIVVPSAVDSTPPLAPLSCEGLPSGTAAYCVAGFETKQRLASGGSVQHQIWACSEFLRGQEVADLQLCLPAIWAKHGDTTTVKRALGEGVLDVGKLLGAKDCAELVRELRTVIAIGLERRVQDRWLSDTVPVCRALASVTVESGVSGTWADCLYPPTGVPEHIACGVTRPGSQSFAVAWGSALTECINGNEPSQLTASIKRRAAAVGEVALSITCDRVMDVALAHGLADAEGIAVAQAERATALADAEAAREQARIEAEAAREQTRMAAEAERVARAAREAELRRQFPDTFGVIQTRSEFAETARGVETAVGVGGLKGAMWMAGFADYTVGNCSVELSTMERAKILEFIVKGVAAARGNITGGGFDDAFAQAFTGGQTVAAGAQAANTLGCREPAATKLMKNLLVILNG